MIIITIIIIIIIIITIIIIIGTVVTARLPAPPLGRLGGRKLSII